MHAVYLRESDDTWTPFFQGTKDNCILFADAKGVDYKVEHIAFGAGTSVEIARRMFGKCVKRRVK